MNHFSSRYSGKIFKKYSNFSNIRVLTNWNSNKKENPSEPKMLYGAAPLVKMPSAKHLQRKLEINDFILKSQSSLQLPRNAKIYNPVKSFGLELSLGIQQIIQVLGQLFIWDDKYHGWRRQNSFQKRSRSSRTKKNLLAEPEDLARE